MRYKHDQEGSGGGNSASTATFSACSPACSISESEKEVPTLSAQSLGLAKKSIIVPIDSLADVPEGFWLPQEFRIPKCTAPLFSSRQAILSHADRLFDDWPEGNFSPIMSRLVGMLLDGAPGNIGLSSSLAEWQHVWRKQGRLGTLMAATIPVTQLNDYQAMGEHRQPLDPNQMHVWPLIGAEQIMQQEKALLNQLISERHKSDRQSLRKSMRLHLGIRRRTGPHNFMCRTLGLDAPLMSWLLEWRDIGVLTNFADALNERNVPLGLIGTISDSEMPDAHWYPTIKDARGFELMLSGARYLSRQKIALRKKRVGTLYIDDKRNILHAPTNTIRLRPIDAGALSQGTFYLATVLPPWCPISLIAKIIRKRNHQLPVAIQTMGMRVVPERHENVANPPVLHLDVVAGCAHCNDSQCLDADLPRKLRMPGLIPDTWVIESPDAAGRIARVLTLPEVVVTHWAMRNAIRLGLANAEQIPRFRNPKSSTLDTSTVEQLVEELYYWLALDERHASLTSTAGNLYGIEGTTYRMPVVSVILEEAAKLYAYATLPSPFAVNNQFVLNLDVSRRTLHLIKKAVRTCQRAGMNRHELSRLCMSIVLDLAMGQGSDCILRHQLVRVSDDVYELAALPFWSLMTRDQIIEAQLRVFGGAVVVSSRVWPKLRDNPALQRLLGRQLDMQEGTLESLITSITATLADTTPLYLDVIEDLERHHETDLFRTPKSKFAGVPGATSSNQPVRYTTKTPAGDSHD